MKPLLKRARQGRSSVGASLIETLVAIAAGMVVMGAIGTFSIFTARSFVSSGNYADLDRDSFAALDTLTRDIRQSRELLAFSTNRLTLRDNDNATLIYEYEPATQRLVRRKNGVTQVLLTQCDFLRFAIYQRTPASGWNWYPVATNAISTTKLIDVSWKCSRKILGAKLNTESVQTAKVVIRN
ncbi:MAG: hypothetical protein N3I86_09895 [Verrucomicrobiae bacterium]|nr:hypothetical protein [Verrucomicrobiae bacterium]MDW8309498.1 hypothetical protein [Verrucomicrobiales bacterium]